MINPKFSVVVPVYNRPDELHELLESLALQTTRNFEVIVVDDGSVVRADTIVNAFKNRLTIHYLFKDNSGPGPSRNMGFAQSRGEYMVVFDSDCILPATYFEVVGKALNEHRYDAWGGPDRAHENFTLVQRAMGYTMASVLTTGGIRGAKKHVGSFQPRSFNMGLSRKVFEATGGFQFDRYAEDIELSIRMRNAGFNVGLIQDAFVYHKRRANFRQFFKQVFNFGKGRALIGKRHPGQVKLTHWFPTLFLLGVVILFLLPVVSIKLFQVALIVFLLYMAGIFIDALISTKNILVAFLALPAVLIQFSGYGLGFLLERLKKQAIGVK